MKKIISFLAITVALFAFTQTNAQTSFNGKIGDSTLTNAQTVTFSKTVTGPKHAVTFVYTISNTSGTTEGTITLGGTLDGVNYVLLRRDTLTNGHYSIGVSYDYNGYSKYVVGITQTGTSVTNYKVQCLYR